MTNLIQNIFKISDHIHVNKKGYANGFNANWKSQPPPGYYEVKQITPNDVYIGNTNNIDTKIETVLYSFENITSPFFVVGRTRMSEKCELLTLTANSKGWSQKSTVHPELSVEYICNESYNQLCDWLNHDMFTSYHYFENKNEAQTCFEKK